MSVYFDNIQPIEFAGKDSTDPLSYRYYNPEQVVLGKTMAEHLSLAVCYWHNLCWDGLDAFGGGTRHMPWYSDDPMALAHNKADVLFEFAQKLGVPYFTFHDRDVSPEGETLAETRRNFDEMVGLLEQKMDETGIQLLWGTANLFSHRRYMSGAATNPNPEVFAMGAWQVKHALDATHRLGGKNYVLWGGREGYDTLLNTDLKQEVQQFGRFLSMVVEHKHKIGFEGTLLIEPKPCEPTKHQYDYDTATVYSFLQRFGLEKEFRVNIEVNHATLAGHSFEHEVAVACELDCLGNVDANRGDPQNGWDTDQFPNSVEEMSKAMYLIVKAGGLGSGGFNFDTKVRRQSIDPVDMFYGHIGGIDVLAKSLLVAERMIKDDQLANITAERYLGWQHDLGQKILGGQLDLEGLAKAAEAQQLNPEPVSGRQELLENTFNVLLD